MQQKFSADHQIRENDVEELREQLQILVRHLGVFEDFRAPTGQQLPPSYAQALMVLLGFHEESKSPTLTDMVELLNIDKSNVTRLCQRMKDAGHITVQRDMKDRRAKRIALSPEGLELANHVNANSYERFGSLLDEMEEHQKNNVLDSLILLNEVIERT